MDEAVEVAQRCAGKAPLSIRDIKAEFAPDLFTSEERNAFRAALCSSEDFAEGARARREKRPPRFMGRYQRAGAPRGGYARRARGKCSTRGAGNGSSITGNLYSTRMKRHYCVLSRVSHKTATISLLAAYALVESIS